MHGGVRLADVLLELGEVERDVGRIEEEHDDSADAVPAVQIRDGDDGDRDDVVHLHLDKVLALGLEQHRDHSLEVPRAVEQVVAAKVIAHDGVLARREADPPVLGGPDPRLRGHDERAEDGEAAVEERLHRRLAEAHDFGLEGARLGFRLGRRHGPSRQRRHDGEADAPVEREKRDAKHRRDVAIDARIRRAPRRRRREQRAAELRELGGHRRPHGQ
mmetsp:Transcript_2076/g.8029  ORF Transcript_2076/g.8029 Transcript_2076/m.8029 type:complete len:217 (+) Transcript_2076:446-1096(+)